MLRILICAVALLYLIGCERQSGEGIVLTKEHIAAAPLSAETPSAQYPGDPNETGPGGEQLRPINSDEITVDGYVMKPEVRGTSRDPRALKDEQWLVKVRMIDGGRTFNVHATQMQFDKLKQDDRVEVSYRVGKYTNNIWSAEIRKPESSGVVW